jgi:hypothetical protein
MFFTKERKNKLESKKINKRKKDTKTEVKKNGEMEGRMTERRKHALKET